MSNLRRLLAPAAIVAVTLAVYARTLGAGFIWDDAAHVTAPELRSLAGLLRIWADVGVTQQWYPLLHSFFWVQYHLWGEWAPAYHVVNVLLHGTAAVLLALVVAKLMAPSVDRRQKTEDGNQSVYRPPSTVYWTAWLAAALFALHPVEVESVAWISEQKNTLSTVLYLLAALYYLRWRDDLRVVLTSKDGTEAVPPSVWSNRTYWIATGLFLCAILAKSLTATLPAALLVVIWWKHGRIEKRDVIPLLPWFASGAAVGLFTGWVEKRYIGAQGAEFGLSLIERILLSGRTPWFYLEKFAWPADLIFIYPRWTVDTGQWWQWLFPVVTIAILAALWTLRGRSRGPLALALIFVGSLVPTIGIFNVYAFRFSYVTDHWNYVPSMILAVGSAAFAVTAWQRAGPSLRPWGLGLGIVVLGILGGLSWRQTAGYREVGLFYRTILAANPECWLAHNNLGNILAADSPDEAAGHFRDAVRLKPDYAEAEYNWGQMLNRHDRVPEAIAHYDAAVRIDRHFAPAENELGFAYAKLGRPQDAITHYEAAVRLKPGYAETRYNLGITLAGLQRYDEAVTQFREAFALRPTNPDMALGLAVALAAAGHPADAIVPFETAVGLRPEHSATRFQYALSLFQVGRETDALEQNAQGRKLRALGK